MAVVVRDTITITTSITVDRNDKGDTLRVVSETDRYRGHDAQELRVKSEKLRVVHDTVYIERRDSVEVQKVRGVPEVQGAAEKGGGFRSTLKWLFYVILALTGLVVTVKVCLRKG